MQGNVIKAWDQGVATMKVILHLCCLILHHTLTSHLGICVRYFALKQVPLIVFVL